MKNAYYSLLIMLYSTYLLAQNAQNLYLEKRLKNEKEIIEQQERFALKKRLMEVNEKFLNEIITSSEADSLKLHYAEKSVERIEERIAAKEREYLSAAANIQVNEPTEEVILKSTKREIPYYVDSDIVLAFGLNNLVNPYDEFPMDYETEKSLFFEAGWSWKTNLIPYKNFLNIRYGLSMHVNTYTPLDQKLFFTDYSGYTVQLEPLGDTQASNVQSRLLYSNLVLPIHLELGSRRYQHFESYYQGTRTRTRYRPRGLIFGFGGYGGINVYNKQRLGLVDATRGENQEVHLNNFVYGVSGYLSFPYLLTLYGKVDVSPLFDSQLEPLHSVAIGIRFGIN
jgi:uncharacterized protein (DUF1778 family)